MKIFSRHRIGLRGTNGSYSPRGPLTHVSIHHGGPVGGYRRTFRSAAATWRSWQIYHLGQGWTDIGYHFGVDARGRLYEGRPISALPAAVGGHNTGQVAFVFLQDGRYYGLTWRQRRTLKRLFEKGIPSRGVPPLKRLVRHPGSEWGVFGHQEYSGHESNACPGVKIMSHLKWRRGRYAR